MLYIYTIVVTWRNCCKHQNHDTGLFALCVKTSALLKPAGVEDGTLIDMNHHEIKYKIYNKSLFSHIGKEQKFLNILLRVS